jgi:hypothetical protein
MLQNVTEGLRLGRIRWNDLSNGNGEETTWKTRQGWKGNIKVDLRKIDWEGMDWIDLAQDRDLWQAVVRTVMNLWFHKRWGISFLTEGLCSIELVN